MSIWHRQFTVEQVRAFQRDTMGAHLGIEFTGIGDDWLEARMPVDGRTMQPDRILHGGASVALAETLGSVGGSMCVDRERFQVVGQEINANHLRPATGGHVTGRASPIHLGRRSQVWNIEIADDRKRLVCVSRLTIAVVERQPR
jgi:1,4-dihydroxy-2-naphthoyl-CoA hydrolase